ncbi:MAG: glycosyltransferase family 4 protein [Candidatus Bathyarchaeota archaeon]|nr:MAG: glycosyltransferase family 4 protein [Candidatus Bathyarchaeota archaeon]
MGQTSLCIVTHTFLPHVGGIERVVYEQCKRLMQKQFEPMVVTHRNYTDKNYVYNGIRVRCYDSVNIGFRLGIPYAIPHITSYKTFLKSIKSSDLIHVHGHPYLSSLVAAKISKKYSKPLVLTQHNTFIEYESSFWDHVEWLNDCAVGKQVLKEADRIVAVSNATGNYVLSLGADPKKMRVIHNGVDVNRFRPLRGAKDEIRKKLGISKDSSVVLTVRRLVYKNGIDTLIESAKKAIKKNPRLVFVIVGKGPDFEKIKQETEQLGIEKNFRLTGFISDERLPFYYNAADFFVLPSKSGEGLPLVALEAMACGLPVIATNVGGISEVMKEDYGKLVPPDSPDSLAEAIVGFSRSELSALKKDLRAIIEQKYSWDTNVEKLVEIYEELI